MKRLRLTRREAIAGAATALALPGYSRAAERPIISHGLQSGDVAHDGAVIWARADRPAKMLVEVATTESFSNARPVQPLDLISATDFTGKLTLAGLPAGEDVFYRVRLADLSDPTLLSEPQTGRFRTAPGHARTVRFLWSGDTAGQGWGIDEGRGGMLTYRTMLGHRPDFFIHSGDTVYCDNPIPPEIPMPNGEVWRNLVTEEKSKVAETLHEFRHNHLYNLLDANVRAFNAAAPILAQWDDHEVTNNWWPARMLDDPRYAVKSVPLLAARANRAFREMLPMRESAVEPGRLYRKVAYGPRLDVFFVDMRSYRGPNTANDQAERSDVASFLGRDQIDWLKRGLRDSRATWKVIAASNPLGVIAGEAPFDNVANRDGPVLGREHDIAEILGFIRQARVRNTVWLTAEVHYAAAHHYSPDRAVFQDFDPFWEFVAGPLHAGAFSAKRPDDTFGVKVEFAHLAPESNLPPSYGYQSFGKVEIDGPTGVMTVSLIDMADTVLWTKDLAPAWP